jgi:LTXXQ motif family protein
MVARYAIGLFMGVLLATSSREVPFALAAGARPGAYAASGVHPGLRPTPGAHFGAGKHFPVVRPGGINPGVGRSLAVPIPRLSVPLPHHVIVVGAGPLFWPQVYYYELFGYLFPRAENDGGISTPFWTYGYDDLIGGLFWPYFGFSVQILEQRAEASARLCVERAENVVAFPLAKIKQEVQPTAEQQAKLELAKTAATMATHAFKSSCSAEMPLTPVSRLDGLAKRLSALAEVMNTLRAPLQSFYDSLGDTQKIKLDALGRAANPAAQGAGDQATGVNVPLAQLCSEQNSRAADVRTDEIEKALRPDETQNQALDSLHDAWNRAADLVKESCPSEAPVTMPGRMEAVQKRLEALLDAVKIVRPALVTFYGLLNDEQKARFNLMAPPAAKASDALPRAPRAHRPAGRAIV